MTYAAYIHPPGVFTLQSALWIFLSRTSQYLSAAVGPNSHRSTTLCPPYSSHILCRHGQVFQVVWMHVHKKLNSTLMPPCFCIMSDSVHTVCFCELLWGKKVSRWSLLYISIRNRLFICFCFSKWLWWSKRIKHLTCNICIWVMFLFSLDDSVTAPSSGNRMTF